MSQKIREKTKEREEKGRQLELATEDFRDGIEEQREKFGEDWREVERSKWKS